MLYLHRIQLSNYLSSLNLLLYHKTLPMKRFIILCCCLMTTLMVYAETLVSGGKNRNMIVYAPSNLPSNRPLLISMHGASQDANYQRNQANYEAVADTAKFVVVYPDGEGNMWDLGGMKDINFLLDIIEEMHRRYSIDKNRVYLSGFSMGGMMTYYAANKIADRIAAFAPCSGYPMGGPNATSSRPIPILHVHGTSDDVCSYTPVQQHINAWVNRNGCKTTPKVEKPKSGPSNTTAELYRYTDGLEGVEVAHLKLPGKGHWHSNDPVMALTNVEIWNFVSRWSLTPGPELVSVSPEEGSFDMSVQDDRTFVFQFDKPIDCSKVKCSMSEGTGSINLQLAETGFSETITFTIPANQKPKEVEYRLQVREVYAEDGSKASTSYFHYTYGIEEVGEEMHIDTLLVQDWYGMQSAIGEGIPFGWHRVNSNSDGSKDEKFSGDANTGGVRMKYFQPGGDFDAGMYFSSREYNQATLTYGENAPYLLPLTRGHYQVSMRSVYWNDGARNNQISFGLSFINTKNSTSVYSSPSLTPSGCMSENTAQQVKGSKAHELDFEVTVNTNYLLQYNISAGWDGVIISAPVVTRQPSQADRYKGEFLRTLHRAQKLLATANDGTHPDYAIQASVLEAVIAQYEQFFSTSPSAYETARLALLEAMSPLQPLSIREIQTITNYRKQIVDLFGRSNAVPTHGLFVIDGKKVMMR